MGVDIPEFTFAYRSNEKVAFASFPSQSTTEIISPAKDASTAAVAKLSQYSRDGRYFGWISSMGLHILDLQEQKIIREIPGQIADFGFSPLGSYVSTIERWQKVEDGKPQHTNLNIWQTSTGSKVAYFSHKNLDNWHVHWVADESFFLRLQTGLVHVHDPKDSGKICGKLALEGLAGISVSQGRNPFVAVFVPERKGQPAIVRLYGMMSFNYPLSNKSFYKADEIEFKWNPVGTNVLVLTRTYMDKTGKSYYGDTNLFYLSAVGNYDCHVTLDAPGPVHQIAWGPSGNEFVVVYGNMPAKAALFDSRANKVFDFGTSAKNFVRYSPKGRFLLLAGFGNLAGYIDIWDRKHLVKISSFQEDSAVYCEFAPDGLHILTATLSPRLRVDNRFRLRSLQGQIVWQQDFSELLFVSLRPLIAPISVEDNVQVNASVEPANEAPKSGYVPPHLRKAGATTAAPLVVKPNQKGYAPKKTQSTTTPVQPQQSQQQTVASSAEEGKKLTPEEKQILNLRKKLKQIQELKDKKAAGTQLEKNQEDKIASETELLKQLQELQIKNK